MESQFFIGKNGSVSKPCTPGEHLVIPLKMVLIGIDP